VRTVLTSRGIAEHGASAAHRRRVCWPVDPWSPGSAGRRRVPPPPPPV